MPKVLISDKMNALAAEIFEKNGIEVDVKTGLSPEDLQEIIGEYDGLAIRSSTKVTADILAKATNLKVIGRAGIGVDNVDVSAATASGVIVMNTPFGNSITTAEHAIAMMFALARQIPQANESTQAGKWEKSKFMGVELTGKKLGIVGCGNIGAIVASRALGLKMDVLGFDPFLTEERAVDLGIEKVELDDLFKRSDFITLHTPLNDKTRHMIGAKQFSLMKEGVRIINCARGGLIVEPDLKDALDSGKVAGAALDVFEVEPAKENPLFGHPNIVCTPHLGAATTEAQVNVAIQVAEQMADYLNNGAVTNALNMPSITAEDAPRLAPYMKLAEQLGSFAGQITDSAIQSISISYGGHVSSLNTRPLTQMIVAEVLKPFSDLVNIVSAPAIAKDRGIEVSATRTSKTGGLHTIINVEVVTDKRSRSITGTLFGDDQPRIVDVEGVPVEAELSSHILFIRNRDEPGLIGGLGMLLGNAGLNIADFRLGRVKGESKAVALISLDTAISDDLFTEIANLPQIETAKRLKF